jgi:acetyl esterase
VVCRLAGVDVRQRTTVTPIDALAAVCNAFQGVRAQASRFGVDPNRVAASGVSAGGHLAAGAATIGCGNVEGQFGNGGPDALVLWSPALDVSGDGHFRRLLRGRAPVEAYSPVEQLTSWLAVLSRPVELKS